MQCRNGEVTGYRVTLGCGVLLGFREDKSMGTKNNPGEHDCYAGALPDEPMFVLLARDPDAPRLVEEWARQRAADIRAGLRPQSDAGMVREAQDAAWIMRRWRRDNDGAWREPTPSATVEEAT
jgi:hypothetical protein